MIYLKPIGGLCNRMRSIDAMLSICVKYQSDLTILWIEDASLNCSFQDIFEPIGIPGIIIHIENCPVGFPEHYMRGFKGDKKGEGSYIGYFKRQLKNIAKGRVLSKAQQEIRTKIQNIGPERVLQNEYLAEIYASTDHVDTLSIREMDSYFLAEVEKSISSIFAQKTVDAYIASCYRIHPRENEYSRFVPQPDILARVDETTSQFSNTYGLHIRRSDHKTSKSYSTTAKFEKIVDACIQEDKEVSFFLSTDDGETKQYLMDKYQNRILVNEVSSYDRNNNGAVKDAMVDLYCLSKTKKIFGSHHSSFSQTAADIGGIAEETAK